jgi:hypothetical protein
MKKISTSIRSLLHSGLVSICLSACAFTDYGNRINQEQLSIARLEEKRQSLETQYVIVLNILETHPAEEKFLKERDDLRKKLQDVTYQIIEKRKLFDQSILEWEQKIVQERIQQEMIDKEVQENRDKDETLEFQNP